MRCEHGISRPADWWVPGSNGGQSLRSEGEDALERWVRQCRELAATAAHGPPRDGKAGHVEAARERRLAASVFVLECLDRIEQGIGPSRRHVVERRVRTYRHRQVATDRARGEHGINYLQFTIRGPSPNPTQTLNQVRMAVSHCEAKKEPHAAMLFSLHAHPGTMTMLASSCCGGTVAGK